MSSAQRHIGRHLVSRARAAILGALLPLATLIAPITGSPAHADEAYPARQVRIVLPAGVGGNLDLVTRVVAEELRKRLGQPFIVDNRPGANGNIGMALVAHAAPDGYTIGVPSAAMLTINPSLYPDMGYDPKQLTPITTIASGPMILEVQSSSPFKSVGDLIAYAKAHPGKLNAGSGGNGTLSHLSLEMLKAKAGVDIVHVPYKTTPGALTDLLAGQIDLMFDTLSTSVPYLQAGKLRGLAVTTAERSKLMPDLPTISEAGVPGYSGDAWLALVGPPGLPQPMVDKLNEAVTAVLAEPSVRDTLTKMGSEPLASKPAELAERVTTEGKKWADIIRVAGVKMD